MAFVEDVNVLLSMESHAVVHIKGVEIEIVSDKLVSTVELRCSHSHKLELSYQAAEELYIKLGQRLKLAQEMVEDNSAILSD